MRYRSSDSAVQLWESLLVRSPQTTLKPLTLYRLGWAYRNVGAQGLPRSSKEAFDELIREQPDSSLAGFARQAKDVPWKSKDSAAIRSVIPGLGQLYAGETGNGLVRLGVAAVALAAVAIPTYHAAHGGHTSTLGVAGGIAGLIVLSFDYTSSYEDALRAVIQWNERAEAAFNRTYPEAP